MDEKEEEEEEEEEEDSIMKRVVQKIGCTNFTVLVFEDCLLTIWPNSAVDLV